MKKIHAQVSVVKWFGYFCYLAGIAFLDFIYTNRVISTGLHLCGEIVFHSCYL